jgi:hypothetical protein
MPSTHIWNVCITCRNIHPQYTLIEDEEGNIVDRICKVCKGHVSRAPYKWSPPKKRDDRAWKRIANGEWLWDRRRTRRSGWKNYVSWTEFHPVNQKKGTYHSTGGYYSDAQVELGA